MVPNAAVMKQAEQSRIDGNHYFKKNRFGAAIDAYTQAITLCPNVPVYYTNRALCHLKRSDWEKVEEDCRRAIKLDSSMVKAHYMLGLALIQKQEYAKGIRELEKALDLGRGAKPKGYMVEEIWQELAKAKYLEWERTSTRRSWELQSLKDNNMKKKGEHYQKKLESMVELDKISDYSVEDIAWLCSLSESEIDMLISLKLMIVQRAERIGCKKLAKKFDLKVLRAIALVLMEYLKAEVKDSSLIPDIVKSTAFLDSCNLLKCNDEVDATIEELNTSVGADIQPILRSSPNSKRKKQTNQNEMRSNKKNERGKKLEAVNKIFCS